MTSRNAVVDTSGLVTQGSAASKQVQDFAGVHYNEGFTNGSTMEAVRTESER